MATIRFRGTRDELRRILAMVPAVCAGRGVAARAAQSLQLRVGVALLSQIQQDYVTKARGGTGRDGVKWAPLKPATIARRRRTPGDKRLAKATRQVYKEMGWRRPNQVIQYGGRTVEILVDTRKLFRSLAAGVEDRPSREQDQIFETPPGAVIVGTNVPYATTHQHGYPARNVPARPMWPADGHIPDAWWPAIHLAAVRGMIAVVTWMLGGRR